jgi:hypothetical protein
VTAAASWTLLPALALAVGYLSWLAMRTVTDRAAQRMSRDWIERERRRQRTERI